MTILIGLTTIIIFLIGCLGFLLKRNPIVMFMAIELMLNAVNLGLMSIGRARGDINAQVLIFFIIVIATAEVAIGLGIIAALFSDKDDADADNINLLKG